MRGVGDRVRRAVRGEHLGARAGGDDARQPEAAAQLEHARARAAAGRPSSSSAIADRGSATAAPRTGSRRPAAPSSWRSASQSAGRSRSTSPPGSSTSPHGDVRAAGPAASPMPTPRSAASLSARDVRTAVSAPLPVTPSIVTRGRVPCRAWPNQDRAARRDRGDPEGVLEQVRVRRGARGDQARPAALRLARLPDRLRLLPGHAGRRRRPAGRDDRRLRADVPGLPHRGQARRAVPHARREGGGQQDPLRPVHGPELEPRRAARRPADDAARRDLALLLDLQDARVEGRARSTAGTPARRRWSRSSARRSAGRRRTATSASSASSSARRSGRPRVSRSTLPRVVRATTLHPHLLARAPAQVDPRPHAAAPAEHLHALAGDGDARALEPSAARARARAGGSRTSGATCTAATAGALRRRPRRPRRPTVGISSRALAICSTAALRTGP